MTSSTFNVWEGVYESFADAPAVGLGFDDPQWRARSLEAARSALADLRSGGALEYSLRQRNSVLATLAAAVLATSSRVRILDFGGGPGFGYLALASAIPDLAARVDYRIVEVDGVCQAAEELFADGDGPTFLRTLPDDGDFDIVFSASTLQYIGDWRGICARLAAYGASHLVLADVFARRGAAFASTQVYYGSRIPHWFLDEAELVREIASRGYRCDLRLPCHVRILGREGELPMANFAPEYRLANTHHFMFAKSR